MRKMIIAVVLMLAAPSPAGAISNLTGQRWMETCMQKEFQLGCFSYLMGVTDTAQVFEAWLPDTDKSCIPEAISIGEMVIVGRDFIRAHPYYHQLPAAWGLAAAFNRKWPCKK